MKMKFTHNPLYLASSMNLETGINALPYAGMDKRLITSATTNLNKIEYDIDLFQQQERKNEFENVFPKLIADDRLAQILVPQADWQKGRYVSVSPVNATGLLDKYFTLAKNHPQVKHVLIHSNPINQYRAGELALRNHGTHWLTPNYLPTETTHQNLVALDTTPKSHADHVNLTLHVKNMGILSGAIGYGVPAINSIGGAIHYLEQRMQRPLEFAVSCQFTQETFPLFDRSTFISLGGVRSDCIVTILIRGGSLGELLRVIQEAQWARFCKGTVVHCSATISNKAPNIPFIVNATSHINTTKMDALEFGFHLMSLNPYYHITQLGFAFLEKPHFKPHSRRGCHHAWSEPVYALAKWDAFSEKAWWRADHRNLWGVLWQ